MSVYGQSIDEKFWVPNNSVFSTVKSGNIIYIGGAFTQIGPLTGRGAVIDLNNAEVDLSFAKVNNTILTVIPDGENGWYIGGLFTKVGEIERNNLAHLKDDGTLDTEWDPDANGLVYTMTVIGSTMYVGGAFTSIGGIQRNRIAAIDLSTGEVVEDWNPGTNARVTKITSCDSILYVCGDFTSIAGQDRNYIAALNAFTGAATDWSPNANSYVHTLYVSGSTIYAGGSFTSIGSQVPQPTRNRIAAINALTGEATNWNPNANSYVYTLYVSGSTIYAGGTFTRIGSQVPQPTRNRIAAIDASNGEATNWNPDSNGPVWATKVSGSIVYVGGQFKTIGGQSRNYIAALSTEDGTPTSWDPNANYWVRTFALSGSKMYLGGIFWSIGGVERFGIAAIDATTGLPTDWNPNAVDTIGDTTNYPVRRVISFEQEVWDLDPFEMISPGYSDKLTSPFVTTLALSGSTIYVGGVFTEIGGETRYNIAELDLETGEATDWHPDANGIVDVITVSGSNVYVGGFFTYIGQRTRNNIAAIGENGIATDWDPNADSRVLALSVSGSMIYAGGGFTNIGGQNRNYIAKIDEDGTATAWDPSADDWVYSLAVSDQLVYAGGEFENIGYAQRNRIAAIDVESGRATDWDPDATGGGPPTTYIRTIKVSGSRVYVGGDFTEIGDKQRYSIAALDIESGKATDWDPHAFTFYQDPPPEVLTLSLSNSIVYTGGFFWGVVDDLRPFFAVISADGATAVLTPVVSGWQTLSVPVVVDDFTKTSVWPAANSVAYSYCGSGYVQQNVLENGVGYWISFPSVQEIFYAGEFLEQFQTTVCEGWNIVGSISEEVSISTNVCLFPGTNYFTSSFYIYRNGYQLTNTIQPGMGHWVKVAMDGSLLVNIDPVQCDALESIDEENMDHFIITDANGKKQDLYVANLDLYPSLDEMDLSMPPPLPEVGFDARFEEGEYIKPVSPDSGEVELVIDVETEAYPITLTWELNPENGITYSFIGDSGVGKISEIRSTNGNISFNQTGKNKIRLLASADKINSSANLPTEYSLMQNYPNPFNPVTIIKYSLPKVSNVKLIVYDILGREVTTLVNEQQQPGNFEVKWDAKNISSGVYFYQLNAGSYVDTKKMILLR